MPAKEQRVLDGSDELLRRAESRVEHSVFTHAGDISFFFWEETGGALAPTESWRYFFQRTGINSLGWTRTGQDRLLLLPLNFEVWTMDMSRNCPTPFEKQILFKHY